MNDMLKIVHLCSGLSLLGAMMLYFFTGFIMQNEQLFPQDSAERTAEIVEIDYPPSLNNVEIGQRIGEQFDLRGQPYVPWVRDDGTIRYRYRRPGIIADAFLSADGRSVEINTASSGFTGTMSGYHALHGYGRGWVWDLWALMLDLSAVACIVFAVSGVVIWAAARERDKGSWIMLAAGMAITVGMVLYVMLTK